jgi:hypothetical protein
MPIYKYEYNGKIHKIEADTRPDDEDALSFIENVTRGVTAAGTLGASEVVRATGEEFFKEKLPESALRTGEAITMPIRHPIQTAKGLGSLVLGIGEKVIPGEQKHEVYVDSLKDFFAQRYGGIENLKSTAYNDPVGFMMDLSAVLGIGGGALKLVGKVGKLGKVSKVGSVISKTGDIVNPVSATTRLTGQALKGLKATPFKKSVNKELLAIAKEMDIELPASAISDADIVGIIEGAAAKGFKGKQVIDRINKASNKLINKADDLVSSIDDVSDPVKVGNSISKGVNDFRDNWFKMKSEMYGKIDLSDVDVNPKRAMGFIDEMIEHRQSAERVLGKQKDLEYLQNLRKNLISRELRAGKGTFKEKWFRLKSEKGVPAKDVNNAIKTLNREIKFGKESVVTGMQGEMRKLTKLLSDDMDEAVKIQNPVMAETIEQANTVYKTGLNRLNSQWGKKIKQFIDEGNESQIMDSLLSKKTSVEDIPRIYEVIGDKNIPKVQAAFVQNLFEKATSPTTHQFKPQSINTLIKQFGDKKLQTMLTPNQYNEVVKIGKLSSAMGKTQKILQGSQTAYIQNVTIPLMMAFNLNPIKALAYTMTRLGLAKFIGSKAGQQFLTTGFEPFRQASEAVMQSVGRVGVGGQALFQTGRTAQEINPMTVPSGRKSVSEAEIR